MVNISVGMVVHALLLRPFLFGHSPQVVARAAVQPGETSSPLKGEDDPLQSMQELGDLGGSDFQGQTSRNQPSRSSSSTHPETQIQFSASLQCRALCSGEVPLASQTLVIQTQKSPPPRGPGKATPAADPGRRRQAPVALLVPVGYGKQV